GGLRGRGPRVVEQGDSAWWTCDGAVMGPFGTRLMRDYSAIVRAGIEDDGLRAASPKLRLEDMDRDGVYASVIYGPNLFGLPINDPALKAAALAAYNDWAVEFNRHDPQRLSVLPVLPTHAADAAVGPIQLDEPLAMMIYSGVLERHPRLRLVLAESGIGWLPYFVHRMDAAAEKHVPKARDYRLKARPSEIFRGQVYATFEE